MLGASALALLVVLFPPWKARAVRTTTRFAAVDGVAPLTLIDTVTWTLPAAIIFAPPHTPFTSRELREITSRKLSGDSGVHGQLEALERFERRVHVPENLRTSGELWRDSVFAVAGMPSVSSYEVTFTLDDVGIALRLGAVAVVALLLEARRRGATSSHGRRVAGHKRPRRSRT